MKKHKIINNYKKEVSYRDSEYIGLDRKKCTSNYRCSYKASCDIPDVEAEIIASEFKALEFQNQLIEIQDSLKVTDNIEEAIKLAIKSKRKDMDIEGFKRLRYFLKSYRNNPMFKDFFTFSNDKVLRLIKKDKGVERYLVSEDQFKVSLGNTLEKCKKTFDAYFDFMCQDSSNLDYDFSSENPKNLASNFNIPEIDYSGSYETCSKGSKDLNDDFNLLRKNLSLEETTQKNAIEIDKKNLDESAHRTRSLLCENIPSSDLNLKKQLKALDKKIESACSSDNSDLLEYKNKVIESEVKKLEACSYLISYRNSLEKKEQTKSYARKNKSFKTFLKENPGTLIKSEEEYLKRVKLPSVAKSLFFGVESEKNQEAQIVNAKKISVDSKDSEYDSTNVISDQKTSKVMYDPSNSYKSNIPPSSVSYIAPASGLSFTYKEDSKDALKYRLDKLKEKIAQEESKQKELLNLYNNGMDSDRDRIDSLFDNYDPAPVRVSNVSDQEIERIINEEKLIDSGQKNPRRSRSIASALSDYVKSNKDVTRDTINEDILTNDRIEVVSQPVDSSEKIDAFNIKLGPNGYELQKLKVAGSIEKDLSLVYDSDPKKSIIDKMARSSANQSEQVQKYKKLLQSKKDFLISKNSELDIEVIVRYNFNLQKHEVSPFVGNLKDEFYLKNKTEFNQLKDQVQKSIDEGDFRTLSQI